MTVLPCFFPTATAVATTLGVGLRGADHLEQRHLVHRAEVVHPHHVLGARRDLGDAADGDGRRVRGEDGARLRRALRTRARSSCFKREILEHGFDGEVGRGKAGIVGGRREQRKPLCALDAGHLLFLHALVEDVGDGAETAAHRCVVAILDAHVQVGADRADVGDAGPHEPRAEHEDLVDGPRHGAGIVDAVVLLERRRGEEDLHEAARHGAHRELAESARFHFFRRLETACGERLAGRR